MLCSLESRKIPQEIFFVSIAFCMVHVHVQCTKSVQPPRFGRGTPILYEVFFHAFAVIPKFDNRFLLISHTFTVIKEMPRFCSKQRLDTLIVSTALERALIQVNFRVLPLISRLTWNRKKKKQSACANVAAGISSMLLFGQCLLCCFIC